MAIKTRIALLLASSTLLLLSGCGSCGKGDTDKVDSTATQDETGRTLSALPEAPALDIDPESFPGAGGEFVVVAARPQGAMRGEVRPTVTFSKPVKSLEMVEAQREQDQAQPFAKIEPALEGEWRWLGSASAEFVPKGLVPYSTEFVVTVFKGLKALDGSELPSDYVYKFSTPTLALQQTYPSSGYQWIAPDQKFRLLFDQPVKEAELSGAITFRVEGEAAPRAVKVLARTSIADERRQKEGERAYERMDYEERGFKNQQTRYELVAEGALPKGATVHMEIAGTLSGEQGPLPMGRQVKLNWKVYGDLELKSARMCSGDFRCPFGPLVIFTSNQVDAESLKGKLSISPEVEIDWERVSAWGPEPTYGSGERPYVAIPGKFTPGTTYQVKVAAGVVDQFKQKSQHPFNATVKTNDLAPQLRTGGYQALVEKAFGPRLLVDVANLKQLEVAMWNLTLPEMARLMSRNYYDEQSGVSRPPDFTEVQSLDYAWNQIRTHGIELAPIFGEKKTGAALLQLNSPNLEYRPRMGYRTLAQITDLAVHLKIGPKKSLAWVTRISDGQPVEGADVVVLDKTGAQKWTGVSDANGFADLPGVVELNISDAKYAWQYPFMLVAASKDGDQSVTANSWTSGVEPYEFGITQGWESTRPESSGFVFTERGVYRPGDKVYIKGVARFRQVGALKAPSEGSTLTLEVEDSRGERVKKETVKVSRYGTFQTEVEIPKEAPTGYFSISTSGNVSGGEISFGGSFRVEEYRAPQFKVDVDPAKKDLIAGDSLEGKVFARYLFGGAMSNAQVKWAVHRNTTYFSPESAKGFVFGQETWWWDDQSPDSESSFFASGDGVVDAKGELEVKAGKVEAPGEKTYAYTLEAEVEDVNRQAVAGRSEITVHPADYYVGVRGPVGFMQADKEYPLQTVVVDTSGNRAGGHKVEVAISSRTWKSIKKKDASGGYTTVSEPVETQVHSCSLTSEDSPVACQFKPSSSGFFIVRASVTDAKQRKHSSSIGVYVTGPGFIAWQRNDSDRIDLVPDKTSYDVGDVAKVLVKSPYPEARALLTVEREGVLERRPVHLKGSVETVEIPITEEMVPNVYAGILLMRQRVAEGGIETGDDPGRPAARVGLVKLNVEKKTKRLAVKVSTDKAEYQPAQEVTVDVSVTDSAGKGARSEVTLYVVDEAVLRLTNYQTPDPLASIYPERPLSVRIGEPLLHLVRRRSYGEKAEEQGGGGGRGEGSGFRSNFQTTVLFNPTLETDGDGKARVKFKLPDNLTSFRIMAVAITDADRFGSGDTAIKVNKPLLALPALPRFARVGDKFEAGVVVHSYGGGTGEVTVSATVENAQLTGPAQQQVSVTDQSPKEVRFQFTADRPGTAVFRFKAIRGADSDGVEHKIPIELPVTMEAVAVYGDTQDKVVEGIVPPSDVWTGMGGLEVSMTSTSLGNFQQGMRQLVEYPYGCLEQQSSRLIPFVALREISGKFGVPWPGADKKKLAQEAEVSAWIRTYLFDTLDVSEQKDPDQVIASTVKSIQSLQSGDGSFRYWSSSWCSSSWASAYATLALYRAHEVGFEVDPERLLRAERFLTQVAGGKCAPCELSCPDETRTFAVYVLSRMRKPKPSYYGQLYSRREKLPLFTKALLADAMFVGGGDRNQAKALLQEILNHAKESPKGVHFEEVHGQTYATLWHSDTRTTGAVLQTLTDIAPDHPYVGKMARYLTGVRQGDGQWRSTQEAAFSLMALAEVVRTKEKDTPDFKAMLAMGGTPMMEETFKGRSMEVKHKKLTMEEVLAKAGGKEQKLTFSKEGPGVLYYSALLRYAPKQLPMKPLDQGLFVQRWFEPYSGGGQASKFYAGELVRVRVRVGTNQQRHWAAFEVPLPAGLEPVDTSLATTARLTSEPREESRDVEYDYEDEENEYGGSAYEEEDDYDNRWARSFWSPFNHVEQRDSRVVLFADHLPPGIHVASFVARATTPGSFLLKPARGELMYEPEVFGRSEGGTLEVALPAQVSAK